MDPPQAPGAHPHQSAKQHVLESPGQLPSIPGIVSAENLTELTGCVTVCDHQWRMVSER
jgi:hypothetical protein